ncbi:hypothetical protein Asp14428_30500 [Actinoplanes sp. NBRC 14428]|nr:hypothetical protein Asp14428_30500 [Actinoplanes sp. NBRC 14428]
MESKAREGVRVESEPRAGVCAVESKPRAGVSGGGAVRRGPVRVGWYRGGWVVGAKIDGSSGGGDGLGEGRELLIFVAARGVGAVA